VSLGKTVSLSTAVWVLLVGGLHAGLNLNLFRKAEREDHQFKVGFLPVT
jgi:hypothetical protein